MRIVASGDGAARPVEIHIHYRIPACVVTAPNGVLGHPHGGASLESALKPIAHRDVHRLVEAGLCKLFPSSASVAIDGESDGSAVEDDASNASSRDTVSARRAMLTARESEVMDLMLTGRTQKQIAAELKVSVQTAAKHRAKVLEKLGVVNDVELLRLTLALDAPS
jgi:DNA-binding CsgD family transcriptional regulator